MTSYEVGAAEVGVHSKTLAAGVVDSVTFAEDLREIEVMTSGASDIFVSFGDVVPTVNGNQCFRIQSLVGSVVLPVKQSGPTKVNLISAGTPVYSVSRTSMQR